ncbi:DUF1127 domain-containing protein [Vibrio sp. 99-8-1]|uniref:DUF1127 domain-containing protein n=1 Tax=Vibrio sp. 99-8-1 TaxID=2607602 RepID=UPI001493B830|nr:DUF1127 domain-containing protein [Vibrio sp. 99-8-1]NOI66692.1 DUF1127 domain-containing protein [Vibrio sp. 99-8-1]
MSHALISVEYRAAYFVKNTVKYFYTLITRWQRNWSTRKHLAAQSDFMLEDVGITHEQAKAEANKPFWR